MFFVFAVNEAAERAKLTAMAVRDGVKPSNVAKVVADWLQNARPKPLKEYSTPGPAREYADVLRATPGFRDVSVVAKVLTPPRKDGAKPGTKFVLLHELDSIDPSEQLHLKSLVDGSRFAPGVPSLNANNGGSHGNQE